MIFQLIDDHSRFALASHVAHSETADAAIAVVNKAITAHGVPQRLLSDNGTAFNPTRRGVLGRLVIHLKALGVEPITGKPYKPTTQGKNERFHQTLFRWLDKQPLAGTLRQLQSQVDQFDYIYNTLRPHQGLPDRITPQQAWDATPVAEPPTSKPGLVRTIETTQPAPRPATPRPATPVAAPTAAAASPHRRDLDRKLHVAEGLRTTTVRHNGTVRARRTSSFTSAAPYAGRTVHVLYHPTTIEFFDRHGTLITEAAWPAPGINYVSTTTTTTETPSVTDVLTHQPTVTNVLRQDLSVTNVLIHQPSPQS